VHLVSSFNNSYFPLSLWFIGLPCACKTTLAQSIHSRLKDLLIPSKLLDGDDLRRGMNKNLGYSMADRRENIRRVAEISNLFLEEGFITLNAVVCPLNEMRTLAREIVGEKHYVEVFVNAPLEVCETRDLKDLYRKARNGEIKEFTGINSPFEVPVQPNILIDSNILSIEESVNTIFTYLNKRITIIEKNG